MSISRLTKTIIVCAFLGLAISTYSLLHNSGYTSGSFCTLSETVNCDLVNKGVYSTILGIPVALIGVLGYLFLLIGAVLKLRQPSDEQLSIFLVIASGVGFAFSVYLTSLEAFVLSAWCLLCISSQLIIFAAFILSILLLRLKPKLEVL